VLERCIYFVRSVSERRVTSYSYSFTFCNLIAVPNMVVLLFFRAPFVPLRAIFFIMCGLTSCVVQYLQLDNNIDMTEAFLRADETVMK
jgi:hypothetical protein